MMIDEIDVRPLTGPAIEAALDAVAELRITVFRDWPYLYDGTLERDGDTVEACECRDPANMVQR